MEKNMRSKNNAINPRQMWANNRFWMETENRKTKRYGGKSHHHWHILLAALKIFEVLLKCTGFIEKGRRNARNIQFCEQTLVFPNLPAAFDGFTILHLSDLHLDGMPHLEDQIISLLPRQDIDLCVLTGDYR